MRRAHHRRTRPAAITSVLILGVSVLLASPSVASAETRVQGEDLETISSALDALGAIPEAEHVADAELFEQTSYGGLEFRTDTAEVIVEPGVDPSIHLESDGYDPIFVETALPGVAALSDDGTAVFSGEGYAVAPLPHADGSVQIVTVIDTVVAPSRFDYELSGPEGLTLQIVENGMVFLLDEDGKYAGGVSAPWAYDATGTPVPTHFEVAGSVLTQVVDHKSGGFVYPISADPWLGKNLWGTITVDTYSGQSRVNLNLTQWGKDNWFVPPLVLLGAGWDEAIGRGGAVKTALQSKETMHQQYDCHAFGAPFAGTWNLEKFRPTRTTDLSFGVAVHHCNWTTPNQY